MSWLRARKVVSGFGLDLDKQPRYDAYLLLDCERTICDYAEIHLPADILDLGGPGKETPE